MSKELFKPGQSGNPAGRPKGSKNKKTLLQEKLRGELEKANTIKDAIEVFKVITEQAKAGDGLQQKLFVEITGMSKLFDDQNATNPIINITIGATEPPIIEVESENEG